MIWYQGECYLLADIKTPQERSRNMSAIRGKNTKPEVYLRKLLFAKGYRYRTNSAAVPGHPDIWLRKYNTAIFINGCFWHRHKDCKYAYMPKSRVDFWEAKFKANENRDNTVRETLHIQGVKCLTVWECTIRRMEKNTELAEEITCQIEAFLHGDDFRQEL